jgi:twitching motility protein PilU
MELQALLKILATQDGSDLYLSTGAPPCAKFNGVLKPLSADALKPGEVAVVAASIMDAEQKLEFERDLEMNLALSVSGVGRFRVNIFKQRNEVSIVARNIKLDIPRFEDLKLPPILLDVVMQKRGLVLFVGATGSGKSTSLAALIDYRNRSSSGHIITIEDPVEYIHRHKKSIINQREVGVDTRSFQAALKNTLRQAPDVILIGEIRDRETMEHALAFADTGHLAISTLHANNANQALDRIINFSAWCVRSTASAGPPSRSCSVLRPCAISFIATSSANSRASWRSPCTSACRRSTTRSMGWWWKGRSTKTKR